MQPQRASRQINELINTSTETLSNHTLSSHLQRKQEENLIQKNGTWMENSIVTVAHKGTLRAPHSLGNENHNNAPKSFGPTLKSTKIIPLVFNQMKYF